MKTIINWHETKKELPEVKVIKIQGKEKEKVFEVDEPLLVIWENRVKPSRYLHETETWEGHTKNEVPEYWVKYSELTFLSEVKDD